MTWLERGVGGNFEMDGERSKGGQGTCFAVQ